MKSNYDANLKKPKWLSSTKSELSTFWTRQSLKTKQSSVYTCIVCFFRQYYKNAKESKKFQTFIKRRHRVRETNAFEVTYHIFFEVSIACQFHSNFSEQNDKHILPVFKLTWLGFEGVCFFNAAVVSERVFSKFLHLNLS